VAELYRSAPTLQVFGSLRIRTQGRTRDVLLGSGTFCDANVPVIDWDHAPLAEVYFGFESGETYEIDVGDRTLYGEVLRRTLMHVRSGELLELQTPETVIHRQADGRWIPRGRTVQSPLRPRPPHLQTRPLSIAQIMLDPAQQRAAELPSDHSLLVLGEAGFGKSTTALHRLAGLARRARAEGRSFSALVIVPSEGLRRLCEIMLSGLGIEGVMLETFERWIVDQARAVFPDLPRRVSRDTSALVSRLKRHPALREVFGDLVAGTPAMKAYASGYHDEEPTARDVLLHLFGDRALLERVVAAAGDELPPRAIEETLAHTRIQFTPTTERRHADVDAVRLRTLDGRPIDEGTPWQDVESIDTEDCAVLFDLHHLRTGTDASDAARLATYDHVVLDEAQELAPVELAVLGRAVRPGGTVTVAGDERQQVDTTVVFRGWPETLRELGTEHASAVRLQESYRCPPAIEAVARSLFARSGPQSPALPGDPGGVAWSRFHHACHQTIRLIEGVNGLREDDPRASIALICRHRVVAERLHRRLSRAIPIRLALDGRFDFRSGALVTSVEEVRGLEFDHVVVPDASAATYPDAPEARNALYVAITRAMHGLWLTTTGPWSPWLRPAAPPTGSEVGLG
jgi:DNA helicase IV